MPHFIWLPTAASPAQSHDHEQDHGADGGGDDCGNNPDSEMNTEAREQQARDEGADDSNDNVAHQTIACALHDLTGEPAGNRANQQNDEQTFTRHVHDCFLPVEANRSRPSLAMTRASLTTFAY